MERALSYDELVASLPENQRPADGTTKRVERDPRWVEDFSQNARTLRGPPR
jgi:hypothetical protein